MQKHHYVPHTRFYRSSESSIVRLWEVLKQRFTESTKICNSHCGIVCRFIHNLHGVWSVELHVQFRYLLPQCGEPQLLEDVVDKDTDECCKCYGNRDVPNCKLIFS